MDNKILIVLSILGYGICMAFICDIQKQINAIHKELRDMFCQLNNEVFKLATKGSKTSNNNPPDTSK